MKATQLIEQLQALVAEHGDLEVFGDEDQCGTVLPAIVRAAVFSDLDQDENGQQRSCFGRRPETGETPNGLQLMDYDMAKYFD